MNDEERKEARLLVAALAMHAMLSRDSGSLMRGESTAEASVQQADALLAELEKTSK